MGGQQRAEQRVVESTRVTTSHPASHPVISKAAGGVVAGAVLRLARNQTGATRDEFAERTGVDVSTIKSWETGRRPLVHSSGATIRRIRWELHRSRADKALVRALEVAMDADWLIEQVLDQADPETWLLAQMVATQEVVGLISWPLTGQPPSVLARIMDTTRRNEAFRFPAGVRAAFFDTLRAGTSSKASHLLRRQSYYLTSRDDRHNTDDWLRETGRRELGHPSSDDWPAGWAMRRSVSVGLAHQGDPSMLRDLITDHIDDDERGQGANLMYWAYWLTAGDGREVSDTFMVERRPTPAAATHLLRHLAVQLRLDNPCLDLSAYTVAALLRRWGQRLLQDDPTLGTELVTAAQQLLDSGQIDYPLTLRALDHIALLART